LQAPKQASYNRNDSKNLTSIENKNDPEENNFRVIKKAM
jgi:hypothetical protein